MNRFETSDVHSRMFARVSSAATFVVSAVIVLYFSLVASSPITTRPETVRLRRFFTAQAEAMLNGRLWIDRSDGAGECFVADDRCYGYFGITPSLLRLPFLGIANGAGMTEVFLIVGLLFGIAGSLVLVHVVFDGIRAGLASGWSKVAFVSALVIAGPGNLWVQLTRSTGYEEAIVWASAFAAWGMVALVMWWRTGESRWLGFATLAFVLGANTRPSLVPLSIAAATVVVAFLIAQRKTIRDSRAVAWATTMAFFPLATMVGVWFVKFGTFLPSLATNESVMQSSKWSRVLAANGGHDSWWGFIPTNLVQYLRPDSLIWIDGHLAAVRPSREDPLILPPLEGMGIFVTPMASVTALVPAAVLLIAVALWRTPQLHSTMSPAPLPRLVSVGIALASWAPLALLAINAGVQNRYMGDLAPAIAITAAFGCAAVAEGRGINRRLRAGLVIAIAILAIAGLAIGVLFQSGQLARFQ